MREAVMAFLAAPAGTSSGSPLARFDEGAKKTSSMRRRSAVDVALAGFGALEDGDGQPVAERFAVALGERVLARCEEVVERVLDQPLEEREVVGIEGPGSRFA